MKLEGLTINFLGDSITEGCGTTSPDKAFHQLIKDKYNLKYAYNYGVGGTRIARQFEPSKGDTKYDLTFEIRAEVMDKNADAIVVFGGTNDYGHGDAPFGRFEDREETSFYGACHVLMRKLIEKYVDKPIVFLMPLHRTNDDKPATTVKSQILKDFVDAEKRVCEYYSIPVIDLFGASGMCSAVEVQNKFYFADGLHPNDAGHEKIAKIVENFLKNF